jgi:hypothetical protein
MSNSFAKFFCGLMFSVLAWNVGVSTCLAHPDHPVQVGSSDSLLHYFVQPEHALPFVVFAVAIWWISRIAKPRLLASVASKKIVQVEDRR